jgi:hypothetical protein
LILQITTASAAIKVRTAERYRHKAVIE